MVKNVDLFSEIMQDLANEHCLTCFQSKNQSLLRIQSEEIRGIEGALRKHFWFTEDDFRQGHICLPCWKQVDSFHRFHETVEKLYKRGSSGEMSPSKLLVKSEPQNEEALEFLDENDDSMAEDIKQEPEAYSWDETMEGQEDIIADGVKEEASAWAVEMNAGSDSEQSDTENELKDLEVAMQNNPRTKTKEERWKEDEYIREHVKYTCEQCGTTSLTFTMFLKHASDAHGNKKAFIVCCGNRFYKKIRLYQHVQWVNDPETFRCEACKRNYGNAEGIRRHMKEFHATEDEKKFKCDRCDQSFARQYKFKLHVQDHINWENQNLKCEHCNKTYKSLHILNNHIKLYHTQPTTFICDICAKGFHLKSHFIKHKMEHDAPDQLKMQCTICSRWLKNRENWRRHMQMHRGTEMKCPHCGHMSPHARALKGHIRRQHNEQKPIHSCQFCSKTFVQLISLKEHIAAIHVDDALYNCPFCSKSFNSSSNMHTHKKRMHPNEWLEEHNSKYYTK